MPRKKSNQQKRKKKENLSPDTVSEQPPKNRPNINMANNISPIPVQAKGYNQVFPTIQQIPPPVFQTPVQGTNQTRYKTSDFL